MKLTPPSLQNLKRRETFFKANPEFKNAKNELERISLIKKFKNIPENWVLKKKVKIVDKVEVVKEEEK